MPAGIGNRFPPTAAGVPPLLHPPLHRQLSRPLLFRRWKSYNDRYDPSCPWRGRSCANVPWRYWKACCAGKKAVGLKDGACRPAPVGSTCASRGPANLDACESNHRHLVLCTAQLCSNGAPPDGTEL